MKNESIRKDLQHDSNNNSLRKEIDRLIFRIIIGMQSIRKKKRKRKRRRRRGRSHDER